LEKHPDELQGAIAEDGHFAAWEQPELFSAELRTASDRCASCDQIAHRSNGQV
jgi:hypothetical protein